MNDFEVIPDAERPERGQSSGRPKSPLVEALLAGKTVFVGRAPGSIASTCQRHLAARNLTLRTRPVVRDGIAGTVAWTEPRS